MGAMKKSLLLALAFASPVFAADGISAKREGRQVVIRSGEDIILRYQAEPGLLPRPEISQKFTRGGYIQAIFTPSGKLVTDDFPADHLHHHGVWSPWTKTEFEGRHPDFWNMGGGTGTVEFVALDEIWAKDDRAGFTARHKFVDLSAKPPKDALLETWKVSAGRTEAGFIIDFTSIQRCASDSPLKLPTYRYGGFGIRGNAAWNGPQNCRFLSDGGITDRVKLNTQRVRWCWMGGEVDGKTCGVTLLCHPENFRFPQPVRANPDQPFFCFAPQQLGEIEITPGDVYVSRYRLLVADGGPDAEVAEKLWKMYAK